jgi:hypothetical protein
MPYTINYELLYSIDKPENTSIEYITKINYDDLNGLFPEIIESDWSKTKKTILSLLPPTITLGITPGLIDWKIDIDSSFIQIILTFDNKESFNNYCIKRQNQAEYGLVLGFPESSITSGFVVSDFITIQGRDIIDSRPGHSIINAPLGLWLITKYHLYRGSTIKLSHTET